MCRSLAFVMVVVLAASVFIAGSLHPSSVSILGLTSPAGSNAPYTQALEALRAARYVAVQMLPDDVHKRFFACVRGPQTIHTKVL